MTSLAEPLKLCRKNSSPNDDDFFFDASCLEEVELGEAKMCSVTRRSVFAGHGVETPQRRLTHKCATGFCAEKNTASVTDMKYWFYKKQSFNENIGGWNTASVTSMMSGSQRNCCNW